MALAHVLYCVHIFDTCTLNILTLLKRTASRANKESQTALVFMSCSLAVNIIVVKCRL